MLTCLVGVVIEVALLGHPGIVVNDIHNYGVSLSCGASPHCGHDFTLHVSGSHVLNRTLSPVEGEYMTSYTEIDL